jgi:hypothetical protein
MSFRLLSRRRPHGIALVLALAFGICYILAGGRRGRSTLIDLPWGLTRGWMLLISLALLVAYLALQFSRGEMDSADDDPPTTLHLNEK